LDPNSSVIGTCSLTHVYHPHCRSTIEGACLACSSLNATESNAAAISLEKMEPLLWLMLALALSFLVVFALVFLIQRREGGSLMGGLFRAIDFFCYLIILLQTTLYIANDSVKSTLEVVLDRFDQTPEGYVRVWGTVSWGQWED